ncbi:MAG TPA: AAA family ATPase [Candidatus Saccharimonadales bacterium]
MMTNKPLLHPSVEKRLQALLERRPHAVLLAAPAGAGKETIARWLASELLHADNLDTHPHFLHITADDGKAIGIEAVRQLEHVISLKTTGNDETGRVIAISNAHLLTSEAQNALLKMLEEPPVGTVLILTSSQQEALLPTMQSRLQKLDILPPDRSELESELRAQGVANTQVLSVMALSGGLPGLAFALAQNDEEHSLVKAAKTARELLQQSTFEKLCQVEKLSKNKEAGRNLIQILMQMSHAALLTGKGSERWQRVLQAAYDAETALSRGTQPKLAYTNLMLNL